jgi:hypothetical protein
MFQAWRPDRSSWPQLTGAGDGKPILESGCCEAYILPPAGLGAEMGSMLVEGVASRSKRVLGAESGQEQSHLPSAFRRLVKC